jgi:cell wall assembly regulator SMI1
VDGSGQRHPAERQVKTLWARLCALLRLQPGLERLPFNPGCTDQQLTELETILGTRLPADYGALLKLANGQSDWDANNLTFPPYTLVFLSTDEVAATWRTYFAAADAADFDLSDDGKVRETIDNPCRVPIAVDESAGAFLCIDHAPGPKGRSGQLVMNLDEMSCGVLEDSVTGLLERYVRFTESGILTDAGWTHSVLGLPNYWYTADGTGINFAVYQGLCSQ